MADKPDKYYTQVQSVFDDFGYRQDGYYDSSFHRINVKQTV